MEPGQQQDTVANGLVAPIGRASALHAECCGFESHPVHVDIIPEMGKAENSLTTKNSGG